MPLPILHTATGVTDHDLVRLFHRTELLWTQHLGEQEDLEVGSAFIQPQLPRVAEANRILDGALPDGIGAADALATVDTHFRTHGSICRQWILNPTAPQAAKAPLADLLTQRGWSKVSADILHIGDRPRGLLREVAGLTIIPARASYRHARELADQAAAESGEPQFAEATMLHLDDPHCDTLLAMKGGVVVGTIGVLAVGDVGRIADLFVAEPFRRQSIARTLLARALEICARSLFKHVMLSVRPEDLPVRSLVAQVGFRPVGQIVAYQRPG